jgi:hypothetical protein
MVHPIVNYRPDLILEAGNHKGFEWLMAHTGMGTRCGYVRLPSNHPMFGYSDRELGTVLSVHGGITYNQAGAPNHKEDYGLEQWIGFDCNHCFDLADETLPFDNELFKHFLHFSSPIAKQLSAYWEDSRIQPQVRSSDYVREHCLWLCSQAALIAEAHQAMHQVTN